MLPKGHGEEILQRGLALEERVRAGEVQVPDREERWEMRRRWRRDTPATPVVEHASASRVLGSPTVDAANTPALRLDTARVELPKVIRMRPQDPVGAALFDALERGERRAVVEALREELIERGPDAKLLPLWNELAKTDLPAKMTVGDLVQACLIAAR